MAIADRTFSFRAPSGFRERLDRAERSYTELAGDASIAAHISRELEIRLQRRLRDASGRGSQGRVLRAVAEAFVEATEAAEHDTALADDLRAFDRTDRSGPSERRALLRRSAASDHT